MSDNIASQIVAVALIALMLTSSVPTVATATTAASGDTTGGSDPVNSNLDDAPTSTTDSQPSTSTSNGQDAVHADSSVNGDEKPLDTHPDINNLSISTTVENTSDGWLHLSVTVNGSLDENQYPRNYPIAVSIKDAGANGSHIITRTIILSPDRSTNFSETNNLSGKLTYNIRFRQEGTTQQNLTITATSTRDVEDESTTTSLSPTVDGASSTSAATGSASVTDSTVNEPPSEVSFVSRFRASDAGTNPQYLESYSIPLKNPSGVVRNFVDMRAATGNASELRASGGSLRVATSTLGIPSGDTQTLVITYRSLSDKAINVTPVTALGEPIHPGRSNSYVLPTDPESSDHPNCQAGEAFDMCVFTLSDQETDRVNEHHELYVRYSGGDSAAAKVFCQSVITGTLRDNMSACGKGPAGDYTDGYVYNMTGREHESGDPWQRNPLVIVGNNSDVNLTLGNAGTQQFNGRIRLFARENVSYTLRESLTWDNIQTPDRPTPRSCADVKAINPDADNGTYDIDPDGPNNSQYGLITVHCDMTTSHNGTTGGWTGISIQQARNTFGGSVSAIQGRDAKAGYVDGYRPYVVDDGGKTHHYADFEGGYEGWNAYNQAGRSSQTSNSGSYSLYTSETGGSRVVSPSIDTSSESSAKLSYWVRAGDDAFSEDVDSGEDLKVQYYDKNGNWDTLRTIQGGNQGKTYTGSHSLPSDAMHSNLKIRFYQTGGSGDGFDYWHIDDVRVSSSSSGHVGRYQFNVPFGYDAFYTNNFKIRSGSYLVGSDSSEIGDRIYGWGDSYSHPGDFAMGTPNESGPTTSYARYGTHRHNYGNDQIETFTDNHNPFDTTYSENFRLQWMENGGQDEGWIWWNGRVYFRGPVTDNLSIETLDWSGTRTFSNSYSPNSLQLTAGPIDLNNNSLDVTVTNENTGGTYTTRVTESDLNSSGYLVVDDLTGSNALSKSGSTYSVSITAVDSGFPQPTVDEVRLLAREDSSTSTAEREISLAPGARTTETFSNLSVGSSTGSAEYIALLCGDDIAQGDCATTNYDDKSSITIQIASPGAKKCPVSGRDCTPPDANADSPVVEMPIIGYTTIQNGVERKQLVNEPKTLGGPEWKRSDEPVSTASGTQTERATVYNVTINSGNPVEDYEDDARVKLSQAPTDEGWTRKGQPKLVENQTKVKIQSTAPDGDNWVRSKNPVSKSETGYEYQWFEVTTQGEPSGTRLADGQSSSNWHVVTPYESRNVKQVEGRVVQIVDPDDCAPIEQSDGRSGCYQAETLNERQNRSPSEITGATEGDKNNWHRSAGAEPRTVRREVGGEKMYSWTDPGNPWRKIEENTFPAKDIYRKPVYENRTLYTWVKSDNVTEYKYKRATTKPVYKWTKTTYDLVYTFESSTGGQSVYEWTRPDMERIPEYGNQTVWLDGSTSKDDQSALKSFRWTFANGQEVSGRWSSGFQGVDSKQVECPTGYTNVTSERPAQAGAILVEKCENESINEEFIKRVGLRIDGSKYDGGTTTYGPELTVKDTAGNADSATANVTLVPCRKDVADCSVSDLRPKIEIVDATRKVDAKHGMVSLTVRVSGPEKLPTPWRLSVKPADQLGGLNGCPANYHPRSVNKTVDTTKATERIKNAQKCIRNDPLDLLPDGSPDAPKSFVLKERNQVNDDTEWIEYDVPAGAARACPTQFTANTSGSEYECISQDGLNENLTLGTRTGSTGLWDFQQVAAGNYSTCPEGYNTQEQYVDASESIQGEATTQVECERPDNTTFSLKERYTVKDYQRISSSAVSEIQKCAPNYDASTVGQQVNCIKQSGPGPSDYVLRDGTRWLYTPAGAWRECPAGWKTNTDDFRSEQIVCLDTDSDEWFTLANLDRGAWTTQSVPSEAIDYAPNAQKTVWESEYINGGTEQVTVLINPRKNDAITIGKNKFTFTAKPVGASDSSKVEADLTLTDSVRVELCDAKRGSSVPKTNRRASDCIGLDSDYDGVPDWVGSKALLNQYPELYRLNDVCPRNSSLPKDSDEPLSQLTDKELRDLYNDPRDGSPCSDGRLRGEGGELYTVTWDSSDWDDAPVENQSGVRHSNEPGAEFNKDIDYPYNDSLVLGYSLRKNASVNENLVAYYTLNERDAKGNGTDLSYDTESKSESDYNRTVVDVWRKNGQKAYNGYHWSRNPCPAKDTLDLLGYDCSRSPFFDAPPDKYGNFSQGSYINHAWVKSYQHESDDSCPTFDTTCQDGLAGDIPAYYMPNDMWRKDTGLYGTGSYKFARHNFIELSGGNKGDSLHDEGAAAHKDSPRNGLAQKIINNTNGSYTISFWYKAPKVKNNALANRSDIRDDDNTIFSVNRRGDNFDNIQLDAIRTEKDTVGIGWPTKVEDGTPRWKQQDYHEEYGLAPGFYLDSDKPMMKNGQPTGWHHITIVRGTQLDGHKMPGGENGVALYVDGELQSLYSQSESWGATRDYIDGHDLSPNPKDMRPSTKTYADSVDDGLCPYDCIAPAGAKDDSGDIIPGDQLSHGDFGPHARFIFGAEWDSHDPWGTTPRQWETDSGLVGWVDEIRVYNGVKQPSEVDNLDISKGHIQPQMKSLPGGREAVYSNQLSLKLDGQTNGGVVKVQVTPCPNGNCQPSNGQEVTYTTDSKTADAIPLDQMSLEQPTNRYRINITLLNTQTTATSTPVVNSVKLQFSPLPERQSCRDYINQTPGMYGTDGSQEIVIDNESGALVEDMVYCDQTIQGGGWTRFWWYQENQTNESGPDPTISGSLFEKSMEKCQAPVYTDADACNGRINWPDDTNDTAVLVRVVDESGQVHHGAWKLNNSSNSLSAAATEAFTTGATQSASTQCWDAYHYSYGYASFGVDNESCKSTFEYTGDYLYLGNSTTGESAYEFSLNSDGTVTLHNALGVTDVQSVELYFREDSPPKQVLNGTQNDLTPDANARVWNGTSGWTTSVVADNGQSLEFDASQTDVADDSLSDLTYEWNFGDGNVTKTDSLQINHTYNETGDYSVYLTVTDPDGHSSIDQVNVEVKNAPPKNVQINAPSTVNASETFSANASADDADGDTLTYAWDTDNDGTVDKTGQSITHSYSSSGDKTLTVYVSDGNGHTTKEATTITVE